jgi:GNAT superfamily N-acetyltransferase
VPETIHVIRDVDQAHPCEGLFREYVSWSVGQLAGECGLHLSDEEVEAAHENFKLEWPQIFGPEGRMYLATIDQEPAAVAVLMPHDDGEGEIKRMFVRPGFRGTGLARRMLERLIEDAREIGYSKLRLESVSFMREAHQLYRSVGFVDSDPFYAEGAEVGLDQFEVFMELSL